MEESRDSDTPITSALERALSTNNLSELEGIIKNGHDVNKQNLDGNTALHIAISKDSDIEILRVLMVNGANAAIKNKLGKTPVQCIKPESLHTIQNILQLEKSFDFRDSYQNTLMHQLMSNEVKCDADALWTLLLAEYERLNIDFNSQNGYGATALRLAVHDVATGNVLERILNHVHNLDMFLRDRDGKTFLHVYLGSFDIEKDVHFLTSLLQGNLHYCPKKLVKRLLLCQDGALDTPFHVFVKEAHTKINVDLLQLFINAGTELHMCNRLGQTALHCLINNVYQEFDDNDEANTINYLVKCGANIDAQDGYGETPLFYAVEKQCARSLLYLGANVHVRNKFGQTPFFRHISYPYKDFEVIEMLIAKGANVNAKDAYDNTVLHYVAWDGDNSEIVRLLQRHGSRITQDKLGQLPCQVAYQCRNKHVFSAICDCDEMVHAKGDHFNFQKRKIKQSELEKSCSKTLEKIFKRFSYLNEGSISALLHLPGIGQICFEQEAKLIKDAVINTVKNMCKEISQRDNLLANTLIQSGSVGENTKTGLPDEFDFVCTLDRLSDVCELDEEKTSADPGFAYLRLNQAFLDHKCRCLFDENGYLDTYQVWERFKTILEAMFAETDFFSHPNISFYDTAITGVHNPTCQFQIMWTGCFYKRIGIGIDLVPAFHLNGWWPQKSSLNLLACDTHELKSQGSLVLMQTELDEDLEPFAKLRISSLSAEKLHMNSLPTIARDAYVVSKVLCDSRVCPGLRLEKSVYAKDVLSSYMLKNCVFHVFNVQKNTKLCGNGEYNNRYTERDLYDFVLQIFLTLLKFTNEENLPSFMFPWQNVFSFKCVKVGDDENHINCSLRKVFVKLILLSLGNVQDFTDVDTTCLHEYISDRWFDSESESEMSD